MKTPKDYDLIDRNTIIAELLQAQSLIHSYRETPTHPVFPIIHLARCERRLKLAEEMHDRCSEIFNKFESLNEVGFTIESQEMEMAKKALEAFNKSKK